MTAYLHFTNPTQNDIRKGSLNLDLNKLMQNVGAEQFDYSTFKAAYDTDSRVKTMVQNFSERGIEVKTKNTKSDMPQGDRDSSGDTVGQMAKRATDLKDL